jgi:Fe-S cluster biosynthesis and repair protein YggX
MPLVAYKTVTGLINKKALNFNSIGQRKTLKQKKKKAIF